MRNREMTQMMEDRPFKRPFPPFSVATGWTDPSVEAVVAVFVVDGGSPSADEPAAHAAQRARSRVYPCHEAALPRS